MTIFSRTIKAFTLLETLASIAILSITIVGPLAVMVKSSSYARQTKDTIVATYLAEEGVELLQNQFDSLYIFCKKVPDAPTCDPLVSNPTEGSGEIAWRVFKDRLATTTDPAIPSCYSYNDSQGCSFDYGDMVRGGDITNAPIIRKSSDPACSYLIPVTTIVTQGSSDPGDDSDGHGSGHGSSQGGVLPTSKYVHRYTCSASPPVGASIENKQFKRNVVVEHLATFESALPIDNQYNDDLRITSAVTFKGINGVSHTVKSVRFIHARE